MAVACRHVIEFLMKGRDKERIKLQNKDVNNKEKGERWVKSTQKR
jgi:hypothetical protein